MNWKRYLYGFAEWASKKSKDTTKVGAVAVGPDRELLETGYNGMARGVSDLPDRLERPQKYLWVGHAEENLITTAARHRLLGSTVYVTHLCCARCARMMINAGVSRIVYGDGVTSMPKEEFDVAVEMLSEAGVDLEKMSDQE